jgi:hypothetical protein
MSKDTPILSDQDLERSIDSYVYEAQGAIDDGEAQEHYRGKSVAAIMALIRKECQKAYGRGYNTGFQKAKRISKRDVSTAKQLRIIADTLDADSKSLAHHAPTEKGAQHEG